MLWKSQTGRVVAGMGVGMRAPESQECRHRKGRFYMRSPLPSATEPSQPKARRQGHESSEHVPPGAKLFGAATRGNERAPESRRQRNEVVCLNPAFTAGDHGHSTPGCWRRCPQGPGTPGRPAHHHHPVLRQAEAHDLRKRISQSADLNGSTKIILSKQQDGPSWLGIV